MHIECRKTRIVVNVLTHLVYFVIGGTITFFLALRGEMESRDNMVTSLDAPVVEILVPSLLTAGAMGLLCSIFGPYLYTRHIMRGRGTLDEVRFHSRYTGPKYNQDDIWQTDKEEQ